MQSTRASYADYSTGLRRTIKLTIRTPYTWSNTSATSVRNMWTTTRHAIKINSSARPLIDPGRGWVLWNSCKTNILFSWDLTLRILSQYFLIPCLTAWEQTQFLQFSWRDCAGFLFLGYSITHCSMSWMVSGFYFVSHCIPSIFLPYAVLTSNYKTFTSFLKWV